MPLNPNKPTYRGTKSLKHALDIVTKPVFLKRGFAANRIITDWNKIVGDAAGACSVPRKLTFQKDQKANGTLYVEVTNSGFATQMVYLEPMILEKISCYFGYKAVARLKIMQNPGSQALPPKKKLPSKTISLENSNALELSLSDIDDEDLRNSLRSLGQGIMAE